MIERYVFALDNPGVLMSRDEPIVIPTISKEEALARIDEALDCTKNYYVARLYATFVYESFPDLSGGDLIVVSIALKVGSDRRPGNDIACKRLADQLWGEAVRRSPRSESATLAMLALYLVNLFREQNDTQRAIEAIVLAEPLIDADDDDGTLRIALEEAKRELGYRS